MTIRREPRRRKTGRPPSAPVPNPHTALAAQLDRVADYHLHLGFHLQAERLARKAAELREAAQ